jgi:hypothetical protein
MAPKKRPTTRAKTKANRTGKPLEPTRQILGDTGHEGESYSDLFDRLMALKPRTPIGGYRAQVSKRKSS